MDKTAKVREQVKLWAEPVSEAPLPRMELKTIHI